MEQIENYQDYMVGIPSCLVLLKKLKGFPSPPDELKNSDIPKARLWSKIIGTDGRCRKLAVCPRCGRQSRLEYVTYG